jgi:hypothetical protein
MEQPTLPPPNPGPVSEVRQLPAPLPPRKSVSWKQALLVFVGVAAFGAYEFATLNPDRAGELTNGIVGTAPLKMLSVEAGYDPKGCSYTRPFGITIKNRSRRVLKSAQVRLHAFLDGDSRDLFTYETKEIGSIILPGQEGGLCTSWPREIPTNTKFYSTPEIISASFYEPGEFIPSSGVR